MGRRAEVGRGVKIGCGSRWNNEKCAWNRMFQAHFCGFLTAYLLFSWSFLPAWAMTWRMVRAARRSVLPVGS